VPARSVGVGGDGRGREKFGGGVILNRGTGGERAGFAVQAAEGHAAVIGVDVHAD
jgi:hypothetical protein